MYEPISWIGNGDRHQNQVDSGLEQRGMRFQGAIICRSDHCVRIDGRHYVDVLWIPLGENRDWKGAETEDDQQNLSYD